MKEVFIMKNRYIPDWDRYAALARQAAAEGAVLLQNEDQALPLKEGDKVAVFGRMQFHYYKSGTGSGGMVNTKYTVGILDALKEENIHLNQSLMDTYQEWIQEHPFDRGSGWAQEPWSQEEMTLSAETIKKAAKESDTALVILARTAGEDRDAQDAEGSFLLTKEEEDMLEKVCRAFQKSIVLLNTGNIIDMKWVGKYCPSAVLYVWQGGMEGGHGTADILMGRVNPCGRLTDTIAYDLGDYPSEGHFGGEDHNLYAEDIYVGYRYFETFAKDKVLYPFGYGLSYTSFDIRRRNLRREGRNIVLDIEVENTGAVSGKEVVQVYAALPQGQLGKPERILAAFAKTRLLKPGETEEMTLTVSEERLMSYDDSGVTGHRFCYVMEPGDYAFYIGNNVRDAVYAGSVRTDSVNVIQKCTQAAAPVREFSRMRAGEPGNGDNREILWEEVPVRLDSMQERIDHDTLETVSYTGDRGYRLGDVFDGKVGLEEFLAQIPDEALCHMVKGEGMCSPKVTPGTAAAFGGVTEELKDFGIPCGCCADGPSGIRMDCGTTAFSLPNGTCLASTFNEELMEALFEMEGAELRKNRIDTLLGPGMNIHRHPLNGRNFEYFSEDPYLTGRMAAAQLRGLHRYGVTGTIKHFAANNQEHNRRKTDAVVSERALREIYLKGFEIAVREGGAYAVMTSYGPVNGVWTAGNYDLLTVILRGEWKFGGMVMTDWWADVNEEGKPDAPANFAPMVKSQNDIYMVVPDTKSFDGNLKECLEDGSLTRPVLVRSAANICTMLMKSPAMERFLGRTSEEEKQAWEEMPSEDQVNFDIAYRPVGEELTISGDEICTEQGSSTVIGLFISDFKNYALEMKVRSDAGEVAQIPVSVFMDGNLAGSMTINGTGGRWIQLEQPLGYLFGSNHFLRFYFAQSGMEVDYVKVRPA